MVWGFGGRGSVKNGEDVQATPPPSGSTAMTPATGSMTATPASALGSGTQRPSPLGATQGRVVVASPANSKAKREVPGSAQKPPPTPPAKQATGAQMLDFVKSLEIDPIMECEMVWIAEEAFQARLPPGWEEHVDENGRVYFYNIATEESHWQHPMDEVFKELAECWRRVQATGGFWDIEDELRVLEGKIRRECNEDWMELYDEKAERFYYNRKTEESRHDDPRERLYHDLYVRINMVGKMKERDPFLSRAPRPDHLTQDEEARRLQEAAEMRLVRSSILVQSAVRMLLAKKLVRTIRERGVHGKGSQPLKGRVQLRLASSPGKAREVVLTETHEFREFRAAQRLQARARGVADRASFGPVIAHRSYVNQQARVIQKQMRIKLGRVRDKKEKARRIFWAATCIQSFVRGRKARKYVHGLRQERGRFDVFTKSVVKAQSAFRVALSVRVVAKMRKARKDACMRLILRQIKINAARRQLVKYEQEEQPWEFFMKHTRKEDCPIQWKLLMHPIDTCGRVLDHPHQCIDLFRKVYSETDKAKNAVRIQKHARAMLARRRVKRRRNLIQWLHRELVNESCSLYEARRRAAIRIQKHARARQVRRSDILDQRHQRKMEQVSHRIVEVQSYFKRYTAQTWLMSFLGENRRSEAATRIQARARGNMARAQVKLMKEERLWPMKGWFEYAGMGSDAVRVEVQFFANPRFDEYKHFCTYGINPDEAAKAKRDGSKRDGQKRTSPSKRRPTEDSKMEGSSASKSEPPENGRRKTDEDARAASTVTSEPQGSRSGSKATIQDGRAASKDRTESKDGRAASKDRTESKDSRATSKKIKEEAQRAAEEEEAKRAQEEARKIEEEEKRAEEEARTLASKEAKEKAREEAQRVQAEQEVAGESTAAATIAEAFNTVAVAVERESGPEDESFSSPESQTKKRTEKVRPKSRNGEPKRHKEKTAKSRDGKTRDPYQDEPTSGPASGDENVRRAKKEAALINQEPNALQTLQIAAMEEALSHSGRATSSTESKSKHYAGEWRNGEFIKTKVQRLEDLSEEEKAQIMMDLAEERRRKVAMLIRRQKKHAAKRRKEQALEAKKMGQASSSGQFSDEERKRKVRQLKKWLKKREEDVDPEQELSPMDKLMQVAAKAPGGAFPKCEQTNLEVRERRARIAEQRREAMAQTMAQTMYAERRAVHRHVHHHVHYHDGFSSDEAEGQSPIGMRQSASAGDIRGSSAMGQSSMAWRPLVHSASAGYVGPRSTMVDPIGFAQNLEAYGNLHPGGPAQPFKGGSAPGQHGISMPALVARAGGRT